MPLKFDSEKELEDYLIENWDAIPIFSQYPKKTRQFNLGAYGIIDILCASEVHEIDNKKCLSLNVIELKNEPLSAKHMGQVGRYVTGLRRHICKVNKELKLAHVAISATLITTCGGDDDIVYFLDKNNFLKDRLDWYTFDLDPYSGLVFEQPKGWYNVNEDDHKSSVDYDLLKTWVIHED